MVFVLLYKAGGFRDAGRRLRRGLMEDFRLLLRGHGAGPALPKRSFEICSEWCSSAQELGAMQDWAVLRSGVAVPRGGQLLRVFGLR